MKAFKIIMWLCVAITAASIFAFSAQPAAQSDSVSKGITKKVVDIMPSTKHKSENEKKEIVKKINNVIRKCAHYTIFLCLGAFLSGAVYLSFGKKNTALNLFFACCVVCLIYAISDEVHQIFVPGRGPGVKDVLIDFCGALTGMGITSFIRFIYLSVKKRRLKTIENKLTDI